MSLGRFGGSAPPVLRRPGGGGAATDGLMEQARDAQSPSPEGMPASSAQVMLALRNVSHDLVFSSTDFDTVAWATGTITLSDATAYTIDAGNTGNITARTYIYLDIDTSTTVLQTSTTYSDAVGNNKFLLATAEDAAAGKLATFFVFGGYGGVGGQLITLATQIANEIISSALLSIAGRNLSHNLVFSASDADTVAWASGTLTLSDGTAYTISAGNTGNMTARTYIYFDSAASVTVLQTTTTFSTAVGDNKLLLAIAEDAQTGELATFDVFGGYGGVGGLLIATATQLRDAILTSAKLSLADDANFGVNQTKGGSFEAWPADNVTGTISSSSTTVTGTNTIFLTDFAANDLIVCQGQLVRVSSIASDTSLTTTAAFSPAISAGTSCGKIDTVPGWTLTGAGAYLERTQTSVQYGRSAVTMTAALNTATDLAQSITVSATVNTKFRGAAVTFSCAVKASTASRVFLKIDDGVGTTSSSNHTGGGSYETLSVTRTLDASATKVERSMEISSGASISATFDGAILVFGETAVEYSPHPDDAFLRPQVLSQDGTDTTTSTTPVLLTRGNVPTQIANVTVDGSQSVLLAFRCALKGSLAGDFMDFVLRRNGTDVNTVGLNASVDTADLLGGISWADVDSKPAAGDYTYTVHWNVNNASDTGSATGRTLSATVIPSA